MVTLAVNITDEALKVLEWDIDNVQGWLENFVSEKVRRCSDEIVVKEKLSKKNPSEMNITEKLELIKSSNIISAKEKNARKGTFAEQIGMIQ